MTDEYADDDSQDEGEDEEWDPQPAQLREDETPDVDSHAAKNLQIIKQAFEDGHLDEERYEQAKERLSEE